MSSPWKSYQVSSNVLLRCSFRCTYEGCDELAGDIHHVVPRKAGGTDLVENLLGLCNKHHKWVHENENALTLDSVTHEYIPRLTLVKRLLARQLDDTWVRVSDIERQELYKELEFRKWLAELLEQNPNQRQNSNYKTILNEKDLNTWIKKLTKNKLFAIDTETTSLNYIDAEIVGISFSIKAYSPGLIYISSTGMYQVLSTPKYTNQKCKVSL